MRDAIEVAVAIAAIIFVIVTGVAGIGHNNAGAIVNAGCANHGGVEGWGGEHVYSATCRDGYAFDGGNIATNVKWDWPW